MEVSIIIVNWNTRDILLECIDSLERYGTGCNMEIIVVDNGSSDGSQEAVRDRFPKVKLIENGANLGFAKANNIGIKQAIGRFLCLINSDVKVREGCIERLVRYMDAHPGVGLVGPKILNPDLTLQNSCRRFPSIWGYFVLAVGLDKIFPRSKVFYGEHMSFFQHNAEIDVDYIAGCFMFVRRKATETVGLMDERFFIYAEEVDWCKRLWEGGWKVTFFPKAEAVHHHAVSSSKDPVRFALEQQRSVLQYWSKHHNSMARCAIVCIFVLHSALRLLAKHIIVLIRPNAHIYIANNLKVNKACLADIFRSVK